LLQELCLHPLPLGLHGAHFQGFPLPQLLGGAGFLQRRLRAARLAQDTLLQVRAELSQGLAESRHEEDSMEPGIAGSVRLAPEQAPGTLELFAHAAQHVVDASDAMVTEQPLHRAGIGVAVEGRARLCRWSGLLGSRGVRGKVGQEVVQHGLQLRVQSRAEALHARRERLRLHGQAALGKLAAVRHADPSGVGRQVAGALRPQEQGHVMFKLDVLAQGRGAGFDFKFLQG